MEADTVYDHVPECHVTFGRGDFIKHVSFLCFSFLVVVTAGGPYVPEGIYIGN